MKKSKTNFFYLFVLVEKRGKKTNYCLTDDHMRFMHSAFEQIRLEKITNSKIRKDRRMEELFREKFSCEDYSQITYRTLIKNYKQFIKRNHIINIDELSNNKLSLNSSMNYSEQMCMFANTEEGLSEQLSRTLSLNQIELSTEYEQIPMQIEPEVNSDILTTISINQNHPENACNSDMEQQSESNSSFTSNGSTRRRKRRCLTYRRHLERLIQYRYNNESMELNVLDSQIVQANELHDHQNNEESIDQNPTFVVRNDPALHNRNFYHEMHTAGYIDRDEYNNRIESLDLGPLGGQQVDINGSIRHVNQCIYCNALYYSGERNRAGHFTLCCLGNKVKIENIPDFPQEYSDLFLRNNVDRIDLHSKKNFLKHIINYNSLLSFAAISASLDTSVQNYRNHFVYKIHGRMYHYIAPANRTDGQNFHMQGGQYYMLDTDQAHRDRMENTNRNVQYIEEIVSLNFKT